MKDETFDSRRCITVKHYTFCCIYISRFWNVESLLRFNLMFSWCSTSIYHANDGQTKFSRVCNFAVLSYLRSLQKLDACEKYVFYSMSSAGTSNLHCTRQQRITQCIISNFLPIPLSISTENISRAIPMQHL